MGRSLLGLYEERRGSQKLEPVFWQWKSCQIGVCFILQYLFVCLFVCFLLFFGFPSGPVVSACLLSKYWGRRVRLISSKACVLEKVYKQSSCCRFIKDREVRQNLGPVGEEVAPRKLGSDLSSTPGANWWKALGTSRHCIFLVIFISKHPVRFGLILLCASVRS